MTILLLLLAVVAVGPTPPPGYELAAARVPARHWALVRSATIDRDSAGQARRATMSIHLTPYREDRQLVHEVGHVVLFADARLERDWERLVGARGYAAREAFADAYTELVMTGCPERRSRERFLRTRVFRPGEYPCHDASG